MVPAKDKPHFLARAWERVREEVENGHQAYVVCPRIGDGEDEPKKKAAEEDGDKRPPLAVLEIADQLARGPLAGLSVEVLHGRMDPRTRTPSCAASPPARSRCWSPPPSSRSG